MQRGLSNHWFAGLMLPKTLRRLDMPLPVSLDKVVEEIDQSIEGCGAYINRCTGDIVSGDLELIEDDDGLPASMKKAATKLRAAATSQDWLLLPDEFRSETEAMIERFCKECCSGMARRELLSHVRNGMSVGVLKARLADLQLYDDWEDFRRDRIGEQAATWLTEKGIPFRK
jgi:hypothetical protein